MVSLFSERPELAQRPSSFVASVLAHGVAAALVSFGVIYTPEIRQPVVTKRYDVRHLDLHTPLEKPRTSAAQGVDYPGPRETESKPPTGPKSPPHPAVLRQTVNAQKGKQTLVQPDITETVKLMEETPIPTVVIWSPKKVVVKNIVAPLPEKLTASDFKPSVKAPNDEINLGDLGISSTKMSTDKLPVLPTTTSPLVVHGPNMVQLAPVTTSQTQAQPTPTAVMSISDLRMPEGTVTLPPVNQTTIQNQSGVLAPGQAAGGNATEKPAGSGAAQGTGNAGQTNGAAGNKTGTSPPATVSPAAADTGVAENELTTMHITLPKDGQFGAVVVGSNLEEKFPELSSVWNDRVAYTVYLHVGLKKSWILQYSIPRSADAAQAGNVVRLESPWPYNIVRPNIPSGSFSSDAVMVHGFVNPAGRFEGLSIAFPPDFQQAKFVVDALSQWQFRPAAEDGKPARVEVLLIIPEVDE
jgi:hypothetical protein